MPGFSKGRSRAPSTLVTLPRGTCTRPLAAQPAIQPFTRPARTLANWVATRGVWEDTEKTSVEMASTALMMLRFQTIQRWGMWEGRGGGEGDELWKELDVRRMTQTRVLDMSGRNVIMENSRVWIVPLSPLIPPLKIGPRMLTKLPHKFVRSGLCYINFYFKNHQKLSCSFSFS